MNPTSASTLDGVVARHVAAVNAFDVDGIVATFAPDALVNDARREFWGTAAIRHWVEREIVGDHVTMAVVEAFEHHELTVVRARYDGDYDKTNLPDELVLTNYLTIHAGLITSLFVIHNQSANL